MLNILDYKKNIDINSLLKISYKHQLNQAKKF